MTIWLTLLGMAIATYTTRATTMLALRGDVAPWLQRWLGYVPAAVFTALILPPLLMQSRGRWKGVTIGQQSVEIFPRSRMKERHAT